jgi:hypothetical protein
MAVPKATVVVEVGGFSHSHVSQIACADKRLLIILVAFFVLNSSWSVTPRQILLIWLHVSRCQGLTIQTTREALRLPRPPSSSFHSPRRPWTQTSPRHHQNGICQARCEDWNSWSRVPTTNPGVSAFPGTILRSRASTAVQHSTKMCYLNSTHSTRVRRVTSRLSSTTHMAA